MLDVNTKILEFAKKIQNVDLITHDKCFKKSKVYTQK